MTGFGVGTAPLGSGRVTIEARAVNARFVDVRVRMPKDIAEHSAFLDHTARGRFVRGRLDLTVRLDECAAPTMTLDKRRASDALRALTELRDDLGVTGDVPLSLLATVPDLFVLAPPADANALRAALATALSAALDAMESMRRIEGEALETDLCDRLERVLQLATEVRSVTAERPERVRKRARDRIERLLATVDIAIDPGRLEQELLFIAEHIDVSEELTRLALHCGQFAALCTERECVGRKLDFLLQEMAREVNTLGSKSNDADVALCVVELKSEIERMREQVQNVE
ncbi:MAG: YicC family protein [Myxococcales bacterium]|nr:YicC family protein [Myxococcales bacterium]